MENSNEETKNDVESPLDEYIARKQFDILDELKDLKESFGDKLSVSNVFLKKTRSEISNSSLEIQGQINDKINAQNDLFSEKFQKLDEKNASDLKNLQKSNLINRILIIAFGVVNLALFAVLFFLKN